VARLAISFLTTSLQTLIASKQKVVEDSGLRQTISNENNFQKCIRLFFFYNKSAYSIKSRLETEIFCGV
jgi:hypothetical protein